MIKDHLPLLANCCCLGTSSKFGLCCKDRVSARIDENGVKTEKLGLKHDPRGLFVGDLKLKGL
jgi:hypothetical protein